MAMLECRLFDARHTLWDGYAEQAVTSLECGVADACYAVRNGYAR